MPTARSAPSASTGTPARTATRPTPAISSWRLRKREADRDDDPTEHRHATGACRLEGPSTDGVERGPIEQRIAAAAVERYVGRLPGRIHRHVEQDDPLFAPSPAGDRILRGRVRPVTWRGRRHRSPALGGM